MKLRSRLYLSLWTILLAATLASCDSSQKSIHLTSFTEHEVKVAIDLAYQSHGDYLLQATFTPPAGYHLYSKDIPIKGVNGLGRPTLLALTPKSLLRTAGTLLESKEAKTPDFEPKELLVYPLGPVTLSLPVELPPGDQWLEDQVSVTYMACSASQCKPPVVGKIISIRIPGVEAADIH